MIPLLLKIEGLYSYQELQEIDFQKLTQSQIFGIFGATGSGKSSILEAISFALYGQSNRLNQQDRRGYNMMNLKSNRLYIEFDFSHASKRYKFCVEGKRNSKRFENISTLERKAYVYEHDTLVPTDLKTAEEITGLSYENFCRTIIIPQGKFQEFLQLSETDRTRMLKEIFKLEKFELYPKTVALERKNNENITRQETLLLQLEQINEEALRKLQTDLQSLENQLEQHRKVQEKRQKELAKLEELQALNKELLVQKTRVEELEKQQGSVDDQEKKLTQYESCLVGFKPLLDKQQEDQVGFEKNKRNLELKTTDRAENLEELQKAEKAFQEIKSSFELRDQYLAKAEEFQLIISLKEYEQNTLKLEERLRNGQEITEKKKRDLEQMKLDLGNKSAEIRQLREAKPEMGKLMQLRDWFSKKDQIEKERQEKSEHLSQIREEEQVLNEEKTELLKDLPLHISQYQLDSVKILNLCQTDLKEKKESLAGETANYEKALQLSHTLTYASQLQEGEPCPVCGSAHHPAPANAPSNTESPNQIRAKIDTLNQDIHRTEKSLIQFEVFVQKEEKFKQRREESEKTLIKLEQEKDKHEAKFIWKEFDKDNREQPELLLQQLSETDIRIKLLNQEWEALETSIDKEEQTRDRYLKEIDKINKQREGELIQFQSGIAKLKLVDYEAFKPYSNTDLEQLALQEKDQHKGIEQLFRQSEQRILKLRSRVDILTGELAELEKQEKGLLKKIAESNLQLDKRLEKSAFDDLQAIQNLLKENINIDKEKQQIHQFRQTLLAAQTSLKTLQERLKGQEIDESHYRNLQSLVLEAKMKIEEISQEIGGLKREETRIKQELERKKSIQQNLDQLRLRGQDIKTLKQLFARSGFVNYVSSIFLKNLCLAANERFRKLSQGSLILEPTEGNSFEVRDLLNNGQTRSVKTLSGGQTFQAALSLAIALADQVQQQAQTKQNFFFLDEGFGSQDQKSLHVIFQTLKSLRKENRIVGVISHVEELHQEIDAYLYIENDSEKGSQVQYSWE